MPNLVFDKDSVDRRLGEVSKQNFDYEYPEGLNLKPGGELNKKLGTKILQMASESASAISAKFDSWNEIDRTLTAFIELDDKEEEVKYNDPRKPVSIVFPYTYAMMESLLSYLVAAFFQDPIFRYEGIGPEDVIGGILMEKVVDLHCNKMKVPLALHTMFRDSLSYGLGYVYPYWHSESGIVTRQREGIFGGIFSEEVEEITFEGNALGNIDPYLTLPDPNVPAHMIQDGEFFGWVERTNYNAFLDRESKSPDDWFNARYLKSVQTKITSIYGENKSDRDARIYNRRSVRYHSNSSTGSRVNRGSDSTTPLDLLHMYARIIPKDWGLSNVEYPEKWLFTLAADSIIVRAKPLGLDHGKYPVSVAAPDFDGYSTFPTSRLEMLYGLQGVLDWMFNAHVANVRKTINDVLVYDPYLINSKDINSPEAGKRIRIRRPGWGRGVKDSVMQLPISDVTRGHIQDSAYLVQWMEKVGAADSTMMGAVRQTGPERLSSAEFQGTQGGQMARLGRIARVVGIQALQDIGEMFAAHTKQLMSQQTYIKATGDWQRVLVNEYGGMEQLAKTYGRIAVNPQDININFDLKVRDGSIPGSKSSEVMYKMFDTIAKVPELQQQFDLPRIFMHIARENGAKNVQDFVRVKVMPDEQVAQQAQAGNVVPLNEVMGG